MNLQNMAPNAKRSLLLTLVFGAVAAGLYFGAVQPTESRLGATGKQLDDLRFQHEIMVRNLAGADKTSARVSAATNALQPFREALLTPMLESMAMRAKTLVDPLALGAGLTELEYEAPGPIALPVPKKLPRQLHARQPIRISAVGSYQAAVSFLLRLEKEFPLVALEALTITAQANPDRQHVEFILEWPILGASTVKAKGPVKTP